MKIIGESKEIADFILQLQSQQNKKIFELDKKVDNILSIRQEASKALTTLVNTAKEYASNIKK